MTNKYVNKRFLEKVQYAKALITIPGMKTDLRASTQAHPSKFVCNSEGKSLQYSTEAADFLESSSHHATNVQFLLLNLVKAIIEYNHKHGLEPSYDEQTFMGQDEACAIV